jgi:hypothetical protein
VFPNRSGLSPTFQYKNREAIIPEEKVCENPEKGKFCAVTNSG